MLRLYLLLALSLFVCVQMSAQVTLEECIALAEENYPISKYDLLEQTKEVNLSNINKGWLPQINVYGQGTVQNDTPSLPESLTNIINQTGTNIAGLNEWQYRIGADISQNIWDGGTSKVHRKIERAEDAERQAAIDVQLYAVRRIYTLVSCLWMRRLNKSKTCSYCCKVISISYGSCKVMVRPCKAMWIW